MPKPSLEVNRPLTELQLVIPYVNPPFQGELLIPDTSGMFRVEEADGNEPFNHSYLGRVSIANHVQYRLPGYDNPRLKNLVHLPTRFVSVDIAPYSRSSKQATIDLLGEDLAQQSFETTLNGPGIYHLSTPIDNIESIIARIMKDIEGEYSLSEDTEIARNSRLDQYLRDRVD